MATRIFRRWRDEGRFGTWRSQYGGVTRNAARAAIAAVTWGTCFVSQPSSDFRSMVSDSRAGRRSVRRRGAPGEAGTSGDSGALVRRLVFSAAASAAISTISSAASSRRPQILDVERRSRACEAGERGPSSVRQPAGGGDKLGERRAIASLQQFDDPRDLGSAPRRGWGRCDAAISLVNGCRLVRTGFGVRIDGDDRMVRAPFRLSFGGPSLVNRDRLRAGGSLSA